VIAVPTVRCTADQPSAMYKTQAGVSGTYPSLACLLPISESILPQAAIIRKPSLAEPKNMAGITVYLHNFPQNCSSNVTAFLWNWTNFDRLSIYTQEDIVFCPSKFIFLHFITLALLR
jgi:hypothetical protein